MMTRKKMLLLAAVVFTLGYILVAPYQYGMTEFLLYGVTACFVLTSVWLGAALYKRKTAVGTLSFVCMIVFGSFAVFESYEQQPNLRLKRQIAAYLPNAPIDIIGYHKLGPASIAANEKIQQEQQPSNELSDELWSRTVYLKRVIHPKQTVDHYTVIFKRPYTINGVDVSEEICSNLMCSYPYLGSVMIDAENGDLLGLMIENRGIGK
jgi:hypothetical protein